MLQTFVHYAFITVSVIALSAFFAFAFFKIFIVTYSEPDPADDFIEWEGVRL